ncbi:MAG: serine/threonine-protein kinase [Candidatus Thermoplasmatota archaeon]
MGWTAEATFFLLAAAVQVGLGTAIVVRRPRVEWALVLAAIFLGNGALAINSLLESIGASPWGSTGIGTRVFYDFDRVVTILIAYLALAYPRRPSWARRPWILPVLFGAVVASVLLPRILGLPFYETIPAALAPATCGNPCQHGTFAQYWAYQVVTVGFLILLVRWAYLLPRTQSPVELAHFRLLFAAFAIRAVHIELLVYNAGPLALLVRHDPYLDADPFYWIFFLRGGAMLLAITLAILILLRGRQQLPSDRRRAVDLVLAFIVLGVVEAILNGGEPLYGYGGNPNRYYFSALLHLDVLVLRPALIVYAMLRYDFLGSWARRRTALLAIVGLLAAVGYASGLHPSLRQAIGDREIAWFVTIPIALFSGAATAFVLQAYVGPPRNTGVERYLALLEDLHRNTRPSAAQLQALEADRKRLGVDPGEAEALQAAVASRWQGDSLWLPGQRAGGRYELRRLLGSGGWGEVYLADDLVDGRAVVVKRTRALSPVERKALLAEAYTLTKLSHPHLVPLVRSDVIAGEPILVLEHMPGGTLASRLAQGRLPADALRRLADGLLSALHAVHDAGVVHGDVKPGNLLYDADDAIRLADFGLARPVEAGPRLGDPTPSARTLGTVRYLAPEQARGGAATPASDLYAAGVVLFEAVTGTHPVPNSVPDYEQRRRIAEDAVSVPATAGAWRDLLAHLLDADPAKRPTAQQARSMIPG